MAPWSPGSRHLSWAANENLARTAAAVVFVVYCVWSYFETAPPGLLTLLGLAGGAWFGAAQDDRKKKEQDTKDTAVSAKQTADRAEETGERAEGKVDRLTEVAEKQHPGSTEAVKGPNGGER